MTRSEIEQGRASLKFSTPKKKLLEMHEFQIYVT